MKKFLGYLDKKKKNLISPPYIIKADFFAAKQCNVIVYRPSIEGSMLK